MSTGADGTGRGSAVGIATHCDVTVRLPTGSSILSCPSRQTGFGSTQPSAA
jgi:hypothetical protein